MRATEIFWNLQDGQLSAKWKLSDHISYTDFIVSKCSQYHASVDLQQIAHPTP